MKKIVLLCALVATAALFSGCSSVEAVGIKKLNEQSLTPSGTTVAHITATASGFYFLWFPVFTGSLKSPGSISVCGEDSCANVSAVVNAITKKSKDCGGTKTIQIVSNHSSQMMIGPIPFLFYWKSACASGNAVR